MLQVANIKVEWFIFENSVLTMEFELLKLKRHFSELLIYKVTILCLTTEYYSVSVVP